MFKLRKACAKLQFQAAEKIAVILFNARTKRGREWIRGIQRGRGRDVVQKRAQVCPGEQANLRNISALRCQHFMKWKFSICQSDGGDETGTNRPPTHTSTNTQTYLVVLLSLSLSLSFYLAQITLSAFGCSAFYLFSEGGRL